MVKKRVLMWFLFFISGLILLSSYPNDRSCWNPLEQFFVEITAPIQKLFHISSDLIKGLWNNYIYLVGVRKENSRLRKEIEELKLENMRYRALEHTVKSLKKLLRFKPEPEWHVIASQVIRYDATGWFRSVIIDKGKKNGIDINMPVINADGLVGRIISVSPNFSKILLITDPDSAVDCLDERTRARGILKGLSGNMCRLAYVEHSQDIRPGDIIITSGLAGIFPKGIPIGRVKEVREIPGGLFKEVEITPFVDFSILEEVLVILKRSSYFREQSG